MWAGQEKECWKASGYIGAPKENCFSTLCSSGEQETFADVVTGMLNLFSIYAYDLLILGSTLSFVTPLIAKKFDILTDILNEPFIVTTPVGESVVSKKIYRN